MEREARREEGKREGMRRVEGIVGRLRIQGIEVVGKEEVEVILGEGEREEEGCWEVMARRIRDGMRKWEREKNVYRKKGGRIEG